MIKTDSIQSVFPWFGSILFGVVGLAPAPALAQTSPDGLACYVLSTDDIPNSDEIPPTLVGSARRETWCYKKVTEPAGATFIFSGDEDRVRPELSALVETDGTLTHASMLAGELTVHRLKSNYNPMPFPLVPPTSAPRSPEAEKRVRDQTQNAAQSETLQFLMSEPTTTEEISVRGEGNFTATVSAAVLPWRGYWWPYSSGRLYQGASSPLAKYDRYVKARTGSNPGARVWEARNHRPNGLAWAGHCNGWAAASILRAQPRTSIRDSRSGVTFSVSDLKGLWSEKDKCVRLAFFGKRYNGKRGDDLRDIYAREFHNTLLYYIGQLRKPVAVDHMQGKPIDNNVISSYSMNMVRTGPGVFTVTTKVRIHKYDSGRTNAPSAAPSYYQTLKYRLWVDNNGQITKSQWLTKNPDFLWVPLASNSCDTSNPNVTEAWLQQIMSR